MTLRYGSLCSGIEAATVAWQPLGFHAEWFSEIDPFACAVLRHHYPTVPNLGDMTKITEDQIHEHGPIDLIVAGTPCQSFSTAGFRRGLDDPRGNLALYFLRLVELARPRWLVWENVPGVLSSKRGRDFASFVWGMERLGYGVAWRVLDAQFFGVPQRRRRVFVVGYFGDWRPAVSALFDLANMRVDPDSCSEKESEHTRQDSSRAGPRRKEVSPILGTLLSGHFTAAQILISNLNVLCGRRIRLLTALECERLMGYPDGYTRIIYRGAEAGYSRRRSALGNSMAVPVMAWIGQRIQFVDGFLRSQSRLNLSNPEISAKQENQIHAQKQRKTTRKTRAITE